MIIKMNKQLHRSVFIMALTAGLVNVGPSQAETELGFCSSGAMTKIYEQAYAESNDALVAVAAVQSTFNDFLKVDGVLSQFIVNAADGKLIKEITTVTANTTGYVIDPKTLRSAKSVKFFKSVELGHAPMASSLLDGYDRVALLTSVVGLGLNLSEALQTGDALAHAKVTKDTVDLGSALAVSYRGWQGLKLAFSAVGFVDYALNSFIVAQYAQYDEFWWQAYRSYMDERYPRMVTGNNSWAALATKNDNGKAFHARLTEFWSENETNDGIFSIEGRATHYYKTPSPFQRDALAGSTDKFKEAFAARYYKDTLKTTIDTYLMRQNDAFVDEAQEKLETSTAALCDYIAELSALQVEVANLQKDTNALKAFKIKAAQTTYDGEPLPASVSNDIIIAFSATVPLADTAEKGMLEWQLLNDTGTPVVGASKSREILETEGSATAKFRLKLNDLAPGSYKAQLTHKVPDTAIKPATNTYSFKIAQASSISISRLWVTDSPKNETHYSKLNPEQTPVLYVAFQMNEDLDVVQKKLLVRDISTGKIVASSEGEKKRKGDSSAQKTGIALTAGQLRPGMRYRFEVSLTPPNGRSINSSTVFEIAANTDTQEHNGQEVTQACTVARENHLSAKETLHATTLQIAELNEQFKNRFSIEEDPLTEKMKRIENEMRLRRPVVDRETMYQGSQESAESYAAFLSGRDKAKAEQEAARSELAGLTATYKNEFFLPFYKPVMDMGCRESAEHIVQTSLGQKYHYNYDAIIVLCEQQDTAQAGLNMAAQDEQMACPNL